MINKKQIWRIVWAILFEAMVASYEATGIVVRDGDTRLLGTRSDLLLLEDLCDAIAFIDTLDQTRTLDADLLCAVNGRMTRSASMYPGRIRAHGEDVFVRTPFGVFVPGTPDMVRLKDASGEGNSAADPLPADFNAERPNSGGPSVTESAVGDAR